MFTVSCSWQPDAREGELASGSGTLATRFGGAPSLGGREDRTNPEELLLAALLSCFVQTWAIFLAKLRVPIDEPRVDGSLGLEKDPAGGYRVAELALEAHVPADLLASRREDVEKTLSLAERYCIVSKVVRGNAPALRVTVREV